MSEEKKAVELNEQELESVDGGAAYHQGKRITTGLTTAKGCPVFAAGSNFYNKRVIAIGNTCGACKNMTAKDGWHICNVRDEY